MKWRWIYGCSSVLWMLLLAGCGGGMSADELEFVDNEEAVKEFRKEVEIKEQIRSEEVAQDEQVRTVARARDVGPLNELVRHRERAIAGEGSKPVVDIGPAAELERHRQSGGCINCGKRGS